MWPCGLTAYYLQHISGSEQMPALKLCMEEVAISRPTPAESSTAEASKFLQSYAQVMKIVTRLTAKVHWGKSPAGERNHPGPCSVGSGWVSGHRDIIKPGAVEREQREQEEGARG